MNNATETPVRNPSRSVERVEKPLLRAKALYGECFAGSSSRAAAALLNGESIGNILLITAPGRINLIGEHTDYNNCPVLPMAVDREIIAVSIPDSQGIFRIADADPKYGEIRFSIADYQEAPATISEESTRSEKSTISEKSNGTGIPPYETGHWGNYFKAAVNEMIGSGYPVTNGFSMVFSSTIPLAAGMSSSSALVVLAALGTASANGIETESQAARLQLAEMCRKAEWYTGTMGGGMDQAAILLGSRNHAVKIDFAPLRVKPVPFPPGYTIVVTHSTVEAPKTRETMDLYNRRSIDGRQKAWRCLWNCRFEIHRRSDSGKNGNTIRKVSGGAGCRIFTGTLHGTGGRRAYRIIFAGAYRNLLPSSGWIAVSRTGRRLQAVSKVQACPRRVGQGRGIGETPRGRRHGSIRRVNECLPHQLP